MRRHRGIAASLALAVASLASSASDAAPPPPTAGEVVRALALDPLEAGAQVAPLPRWTEVPSLVGAALVWVALLSFLRARPG